MLYLCKIKPKWLFKPYFYSNANKRSYKAHHGGPAHDSTGVR